MVETILPIHSLKDGYNELNLRNRTLIDISRYVLKIEYFLNIEPGQTVVDFGCGDGAVTGLLARKYPNSNFIGIDYSNDLIEYAKENYSNHNIKYITANIANGQLPLVDESVEKIISWGVMYYIHPKLQYERYQLELIRVLKKSGHICHFQIPLRYHYLSCRVDFGKTSVKARIKNLLRFLRDLFSYKYGKYAYRYSKNDLLKLQSNFSSIRIILDDFFIDRVSVMYTK